MSDVVSRPPRTSDRGLPDPRARDALGAAHPDRPSLLEHGTGKLLGFPHGLPFIDKMPPASLYFTGTMELVGGVLIVLGLFTRPVAFILSGFMAVGLFHGAFPA